MNMSNITAIDYDNITDISFKTNDNCTDNENNVDINIPTLFITKPCGLSFLCLMSLMVYTLIKPLINKCLIKFYTQIN